MQSVNVLVADALQPLLEQYSARRKYLLQIRDAMCAARRERDQPFVIIYGHDGADDFVELYQFEK